VEKGIVVKSTGSLYIVEAEDGLLYSCKIVGKFRLGNLKLTNPVAVGDEVLFAKEQEEGSGIIREIKPRKNYVVRQSPRKKHFLHLLASNIDQAMLITTIAHPSLKPAFIDRFLLMTEPFNIPTCIVLNKVDIYEEEDLEVMEGLKMIYEEIGYKVIIASAISGYGKEDLEAQLKGKKTLLAGQSGVGKSSLVNMIDSKMDLRTQEISDYSGKGQHTTTFAEMHNLDFSGKIIDTPGIKTLSFNYLEPLDVTHNFKEMFELSSDCKFGGNCKHRDEPQCAVKAGLETGQVSELRYYNYLSILEEVEDQNYWERHSKV
jgi:ribosome biogenesis GTPase